MRTKRSLIAIMAGPLLLSCGAAQAASTPLAQTGSALSSEPSILERVQPLAERSAVCGPRWIVYLPDGGFSRAPARVSRAYAVSTPNRWLVVAR